MKKDGGGKGPWVVECDYWTQRFPTKDAAQRWIDAIPCGEQHTIRKETK